MIANFNILPTPHVHSCLHHLGRCIIQAFLRLSFLRKCYHSIVMAERQYGIQVEPGTIISNAFEKNTILFVIMRITYETD